MYIILEFQTDLSGNTSVTTPIQTRENYNEAMSVYHSILASAAISSVPYHTATVMYHNGNQIIKEVYEHLPEPTPESDPEPEPESEQEPRTENIQGLLEPDLEDESDGGTGISNSKLYRLR